MLSFFVEPILQLLSYSLVLSALFAYIQYADMGLKKSWLTASCCLGVVLSMIFAWLRTIPKLLNRSTFHFQTSLVVVMVLLLILILFFSLAPTQKNRGKLTGMACLYAVFAPLYFLPDLWLYTKRFVPFAETSFSINALIRILYYGLGIFICILTACSAYQVLKRSSLKVLRFNALMGLVLQICAVFFSLFLFLYARNYLPKNPVIFNLLSYFNNRVNYITYIILASYMLAALYLWYTKRKTTIQADNPAKIRLFKKYKRASFRWGLSCWALSILCILSMTVLKAYLDKPVELSHPDIYEETEEDIIIDLALLEDNRLHRFEYISDEKYKVRFIALKKNRGAYGVGLDACDVCGPSGYYEKEDSVICIRCDVKMNRASIGYKGGCNPVPVEHEIKAGRIYIAKSSLEQEAYRFKFSSY